MRHRRRTRVFTLGISGLAHDSAAAGLSDAGIIAAIEENKLVRTRTAVGIPREAIAYVLKRAGVPWRDVSEIAVASLPLRAWAREAWLRARTMPLAPVSSGYYQVKALGDLGRELNNHRLLPLVGNSNGPRVVPLEHHLCHAASAFYASPAERAVVVTLDENGDGLAGTVMLGEGSRLQWVRSIPFPHSLGWLFSQVTRLIGFSTHGDEHKTQWMGLEGDPAFESLFVEILGGKTADAPHLRSRFFTRGLVGSTAFSSHFYQAIGVQLATAEDARNNLPRMPLPGTLCRQLAASVQQACSVVAAQIAENARSATGARELCLAGGLFLNPVIVSEVERLTGFDRVFVQPAAGNEGTALGAAWYLRHQVQGAPRLAAIDHVYWGPSYSNQEIKNVLDNCKVHYRYHDSEDHKLEAILKSLCAGKIVAWYQGSAEFGPRALGNRSLLASPWAPYVKENLNEYVKHREAFRPFALAVQAERAAEFFDASSCARFMATLGRVKPQARGLLEPFLLSGDRVRLHVVERSVNPALWRLLEMQGQSAPAPILVNTSFNLFGEPLVISPREAVRSYFCSGIDSLVIGSFSLTKT
jgi:carbamoyltransferase